MKLEIQENQINIMVENCNVQKFMNFCESWDQIVQVRSSEPPSALGTPGLVDFVVSVAGSLTTAGILWLITFIKEWNKRNSGLIVVVRINDKEIETRGRNIEQIEIDIREHDAKIRIS